MSLPSWPSTLPGALLLGLSFNPVPQYVETPTEVGPAKRRRRSVAVLGAFEGELELTGEQYATLLAFHDGTLAGGTLRFSWKHPVTDVAATIRFAEPPAGRSTVCDADPDLRRWRVRLSFEVLR